MPSVTAYTEKREVSINPGRTGTVDPGAIGPTPAGIHAFDALSQGLDRATGIVMQRDEEQARAWASSAVSQARLDWTNTLIQRQSDPAHLENGAANFTPNMLKDFDDYSTKAVDAAPDAPSRKFMAERMADLRSDIGIKSMFYEAKARIDWRLDQFKKAGDNLAQTVATDGSQYQQGLAEQLAIIDASAMPQEQRSAVREWLVNKVSGAAVWGDIQKSPTAFLQKIGFYGEDGQSGAKVRKTAGDFNVATGYQPWDVLPYDAKLKMFEQAIRSKATIDADADRATAARRVQMGDEAMKEIWNRAYPQDAKTPRLDRTFVESVRGVLKENDYKAALEILRKGPEQYTNPIAFASVERLIYGRNLDEAATQAYKYHASGQISNSDLGAALARIESFRKEGPRTPYERGREYVNKSLNPGENNYDPIRNQRLADALREFDNWTLQHPKADDALIQTTSKEIVGQYRLVTFKDSSLNLPMPRGVVIRRSQDPKILGEDLPRAALKIDDDYKAGRIKEDEYKARLGALRPWKDLLLEIQGAK